MSEHQYICEQLSYDPAHVSKWLRKFLHLRLKALETDPKKTHEKEASRSVEEWTSLLSQPAFHVVVCALKSERQDEDIWDREWVGQLIVYGPQNRKRSSAINSGQRVANEHVWFMSGAYVLPSHRKNNITTRMIEHAAHVKVQESLRPGSKMSSSGIVIMQGAVSPERKELQAYYSGVGLLPVGRMTRQEHCLAWGIPFDATMRDEEIVVLEWRVQEKWTRL